MSEWVWRCAYVWTHPLNGSDLAQPVGLSNVLYGERGGAKTHFHTPLSKPHPLTYQGAPVFGTGRLVVLEPVLGAAWGVWELLPTAAPQGGGSDQTVGTHWRGYGGQRGGPTWPSVPVALPALTPTALRVCMCACVCVCACVYSIA